MAARAQARGAAGERLPDGRRPSGIPPRHEGHTSHMCMNVWKCSCGETLGVSCLVLPDPDSMVSVPCPVCGDTILVERGTTP